MVLRRTNRSYSSQRDAQLMAGAANGPAGAASPSANGSPASTNTSSLASPAGRRRRRQRLYEAGQERNLTAKSNRIRLASSLLLCLGAVILLGTVVIKVMHSNKRGSGKKTSSSGSSGTTNLMDPANLTLAGAAADLAWEWYYELMDSSSDGNGGDELEDDLIQNADDDAIRAANQLREQEKIWKAHVHQLHHKVQELQSALDQQVQHEQESQAALQQQLATKQQELASAVQAQQAAEAAAAAAPKKKKKKKLKGAAGFGGGKKKKKKVKKKKMKGAGGNKKQPQAMLDEDEEEVQ